MKKLTKKSVIEFFLHRDEKLLHKPEVLAKVCNEMASKFNNEFEEELKPISLLKLLCFNEPITQLHTHSYGFHTATGRNIIETLKFNYYEYRTNTTTA